MTVTLNVLTVHVKMGQGGKIFVIFLLSVLFFFCFVLRVIMIVIKIALVIMIFILNGSSNIEIMFALMILKNTHLLGKKRPQLFLEIMLKD